MYVCGWMSCKNILMIGQKNKKKSENHFYLPVRGNSPNI